MVVTTLASPVDGPGAIKVADARRWDFTPDPMRLPGACHWAEMRAADGQRVRVPGGIELSACLRLVHECRQAWRPITRTAFRKRDNNPYDSRRSRFGRYAVRSLWRMADRERAS